MGLTNRAVGKNAAADLKSPQKKRENDKIIALAGNPNVGKSTIFNALTGLNQHTGNWSGKTVTNAQGYAEYNGQNFVFVDIPGCYSLLAHSAEEQLARDFLCFGGIDGAVVVCDATALERNLNLVLQTLEITENVVVCVNMMDEAARKNIRIDLDRLEKLLGVRVVGTSANSSDGIEKLKEKIYQTVCKNDKKPDLLPVEYSEPIESAVKTLSQHISGGGALEKRWLSLRMLENSKELMTSFENHRGISLKDDYDLAACLLKIEKNLEAAGINHEKICDGIVENIVHKAEAISREVVFCGDKQPKNSLKADRFLTGKFTGFLTMFLIFAAVLWITVSGANYPSELISKVLFFIGDRLAGLLYSTAVPTVITDALINGVYRVTAWVVSVMLPPMAIFFPLFTLFEDLGYLPRIAFNLDRVFKKCGACGKQALTGCMGLGCNAAGVVGCRIIDSPRERLIAMLTNSFVPCNGRFPTLIALITMFFVEKNGVGGSLVSALLLTFAISVSIAVSFAVSKLLSVTVLKGVPSSFTLELPPYRKPKILSIIYRSVVDRTLFVLGRAVAVAAPTGLIIWILSNVSVGSGSLLGCVTAFLNPLGKLMGLDGVILTAFILGLPANEIVVPIMIMAYMSASTVTGIGDLSLIKELLVNNGWTVVTAANVMIFSLMHWPCSTTLMTIKKESGSLKWTAAAAAIPTACGMLLCITLNLISKIFALF